MWRATCIRGMRGHAREILDGCSSASRPYVGSPLRSDPQGADGLDADCAPAGWQLSSLRTGSVTASDAAQRVARGAIEAAVRLLGSSSPLAGRMLYPDRPSRV